MLLIPAPSLALLLRWPHEKSPQGTGSACWAATLIFVWMRQGQLLFLAATGIWQDTAVCNMSCFSDGVTVFPEWWFLEKVVLILITFPLWGARL